ncbi:hypothetical protein EW145_g3333 [Phellinidium pouzarii]|uniref:Rho-GAP domain-containing protein n=1 Tax=Phellinidium pouzarii TaxID=167371 RepID=A0A4S4L7E9_9AGAM|nr:hypothetical protein EW145_g3333 [Phellinidium pouzarii]
MGRDPSRHAPAASSAPSSPSSSSPSLFSSARHPPPNSKPAMGQAESAARPSPVLAPVALPPAQPAGKYRFAWPGRRKKSEDLSKVMGHVSPLPLPTSMPLPTPTATPPASVSKGKGRELTCQNTLTSQADNDLHLQMHELGRPPSRSSAKQFTLQFASSTLHALKGKLNASQSSVHSLRSPATPPASPPPPLPPKPDGIRLSSSSSSSTRGVPYANPELPDRKKPLPQSSSTSAHTTEAETHTAVMPVVVDDDVKVPQRRERREDTQTTRDIAEDWRKSDSTLRTVRLVGSRTPRPLSLAESTNSGHTVLPAAGSPSTNMGASKRLSALMTDIDFGMPEVDSEDESACESAAPSALSSMHDMRDMYRQQPAQSAVTSRSSSPASSNQIGSRRGSLSIRIDRLSGSRARTVPSDHLSGSDSEAQFSVSTHGMHTANSSTTSITSSASAKDLAVLEGRPSVEIASSASESSDMSDIHQYPQYQGKPKLELWHKPSDSQTSFSTSSSHSHHGEQPSVLLSVSHGPPMRPAHQRTRLQSIQSKGFRQTAVSLTTGLGPAAGFARKAVDKLGRALGGSTTSLDAPPPAVSHPPSASSASFFAMMGRSPAPEHHQLPQHRSHLHAHQHLVYQQNVYGQFGFGHSPHHASKKGLRKHAQNAPSGTWSIGSNLNSLSDTDGSTGQGPNLGRRMRASSHPGSRGIVFGRDLSQCVQDTAIEGNIGGKGDMLKLEGRRLPALVTRCAQHILKWGVQEEGLFRISGRSTHVAKIRAEFDSGADYDMHECGPGEIDPHAVSSIFKAYLRELPEPLLTRNLAHYFDAALTAENSLAITAEAQSGDGAERARGPGLPAGPRGGLQVRKAPSLSTFAVPTLAPRVASGSLLSALAELIACLPRENRDLLRTVTELISATARCVQETKMPLSNLLLVFCPSLAMSPPLLRVLCEGEGIWDGPLKSVRGVLIMDDVVLDIRAPSPVEVKADEVVLDDNEEEDEKGLRSQRTIRRTPRTSYEIAAKSDELIAQEVIPMSSNAAANPDLAANSPSTPSDPSSAGADSKKDSLLGAPFQSYSLPACNNSSGSLSTPPSSGIDSPANEPSLVSPAVLGKIAVLHAQSDLPSPATSSSCKSLIGHPVPFPLGTGGTGDSMPATPIEQSNTRPAHLRLSTYSSSSPNLRSSTPCPTSPSSLNRRKSKASLHSLFPKRSLSSLLGLSQQQQQTVIIPTPEMTLKELSPLCKPEKRSGTPCPVLELPVDTSPLHFGLDLGDVGSVNRLSATEFTTGSGSAAMLRHQAAVMNRAASDSSALTSSIFYTPPTTVRALAPAMSSASSTSSGSYSFLDFNISKSGDEDDWATSVLQAAASDK